MVSIIVPVYNCEKYLCECVDSVLAQTTPDWELIIVDDGSTDTSGKIADRYAANDRRITVLHTANGGLSHARNCGLKKCHGQYISYLDADDMLHPQALEYMLDGIEKSGADILIGTMHRGTSPAFRPLKQHEISILSPEETVEESLYQNGRILNSAWGKLYKFEILQDLSFKDGLLYEDLDFFYRVCFNCTKIAVSSHNIYFYRNTPGSIINKWSDRRLDVLDVVDNIETYMATRRPALLPAARDRKLSANFNIFILANANNRPDVAKQCWQVIRQYRWASLTDRKVRLKNKTGILLSYLGHKIFAFLCRQK